MMSSVLPVLHLNGTLCTELVFPSWFGKYSTQRKRVRLLSELNEHVGMRMSGPRHAIALDYLPLLQRKLIWPLRANDTECIE